MKNNIFKQEEIALAGPENLARLRLVGGYTYMSPFDCSNQVEMDMLEKNMKYLASKGYAYITTYTNFLDKKGSFLNLWVEGDYLNMYADRKKVHKFIP